MEMEYWLRWQVPVCALFFLLPTIISIRLIFITTHHHQLNSNYHLLWMPCWRNLHPYWLLLFRLFSLAVMVYLLFLTLLAFGPFVFYFYTQWTFVLVILYFALGTIVSAHGCWMYFNNPVSPNEEKDKFLEKDFNLVTAAMVQDNKASVKMQTPNNQLQFNQQAGFWGILMQNVYQTCAGAVMLTDIVFWGLLLPFQTGDNFKLTLLIGCMHSVNAVFLLLDSALNSLQLSWHGLTYFVLWSSSYVVFQWIMHAYGLTWWPYPFLELATPWAPMWYLGIALVHLPCYGIYIWLVNAKVKVFSKMFPHAFRVLADKKQM